VTAAGREIRILDYIEGIGQEIGYYIAELRKRKYEQALLVLPHDGDAHHGPIHKTYKDHFQDAGFEVDVIKNQGAGAAMMRVEAARRVFARCWPDSTRSASITREKTKCAILAWGLNTIGRRMLQMHSA
jgi:phage terminase large subunit